MKKLKWIYQFKALYGFIVVLLLWYFLHVTVQSNAIPSPFQTILNFIEIFPGELSIHLLVSFLRILAGYFDIISRREPHWPLDWNE